jgi:hypothetical protein
VFRDRIFFWEKLICNLRLIRWYFCHSPVLGLKLAICAVAFELVATGGGDVWGWRSRDATWFQFCNARSRETPFSAISTAPLILSVSPPHLSLLLIFSHCSSALFPSLLHRFPQWSDSPLHSSSPLLTQWSVRSQSGTDFLFLLDVWPQESNSQFRVQDITPFRRSDVISV